MDVRRLAETDPIEHLRRLRIVDQARRYARAYREAGRILDRLEHELTHAGHSRLARSRTAKHPHEPPPPAGDPIRVTLGRPRGLTAKTWIRITDNDRQAIVHDGQVYDWLTCPPCTSDRIAERIWGWTYSADGITPEAAHEWATETVIYGDPDEQRAAKNFLERRGT